MLLLYHFERDAEKGLCNLRSLVQAEIKSLRTCGYKEKDLIPTALYRRGVRDADQPHPSVMPARDHRILLLLQSRSVATLRMVRTTRKFYQ